MEMKEMEEKRYELAFVILLRVRQPAAAALQDCLVSINDKTLCLIVQVYRTIPHMYAYLYGNVCYVCIF